MRSAAPQNRARDLFEKAYRAQMSGELNRAVELYKDSLEVHPTAEAHTYLGWTYHDLGKAEEAIAECKRAIALDPDFGNPYNDIGAYLIAMGRYDEAIEWLERAVLAPRYGPRHYPHFNLGRAYFAKQMLRRARECFQKALDIEPEYDLARQAVDSLRRMIN
jgi:Tfp pilus assembly protein PilF